MLERWGLHCELRPLQGCRQIIGAHCRWGWEGRSETGSITLLVALGAIC
jgi:hypothetical protein